MARSDKSQPISRFFHQPTLQGDPGAGIMWHRFQDSLMPGVDLITATGFTPCGVGVGVPDWGLVKVGKRA
jgi:hypothetical protein